MEDCKKCQGSKLSGRGTCRACVTALYWQSGRSGRGTLGPVSQHCIGSLAEVGGAHVGPVLMTHVCLCAGAVLNAAKRIQLNVNLKRNSKFSELKHIPEVTMLPIYYGEQTGKVTSDLANEFKEAVYAVKYGISGGVWALVGVAGRRGCIG